jgi:protein-arginine deiminase
MKQIFTRIFFGKSLASDQVEPLMTRLTPLWLAFTIVQGTETPPTHRSVPSFRVFADLGHTGALSGPLISSPTAANDFAIVAPLPVRGTDRDQLPKMLDADDRIAGRLGRVRVEAAKGVGDLVVSLESDNRRSFRVFRKVEGRWRRLPPKEDLSWTLALAADGTLEVGVGVVLPEAKSAGGHPAWPRAFGVMINTAAREGQRVRVPFRVAPFVIPSALEPVDELLMVTQLVTADAVQSIEAFAAKTGLKLITHEGDEPEPCDQWMQDALQPGLFAFPTAHGAEQVRGNLAGLRKETSDLAATLDYEIAGYLRRRAVVTIVPGVSRKRARWIDGYGNLEATPPCSDRKGRRFPFGRVITGKQRELSLHPGVMKFLEAQGVQWPPIIVDTSWLTIAHVDEVVNFVPAKGKTGFKVLLPSPKAGREMLAALQAKGLSDAQVFAGTQDETTLGDLRRNLSETPENLAIDKSVSRIREQLKTEMNLADSDFVMMPVLFERGGAVIPSAVNSMVVNGHLLVAEPRGPRVDSKDAFEEAIRAALAECDVRVVFIDSWNAYHTSGGEIHCGTNTFRHLRSPAWWKFVGDQEEKSK